MQNFIKDYIRNDEFKVVLLDGRINIINYQEILHIGSEKVAITSSNSEVIITGRNLVLNKLLDKEILISGIILNIEVKYE